MRREADSRNRDFVLRGSREGGRVGERSVRARQQVDSWNERLVWREVEREIERERDKGEGHLFGFQVAIRGQRRAC